MNVSSGGMTCTGLHKPQHGQQNLAACAEACCADDQCTVYQFCAAGGKCDGATGAEAQ